MNQEVKVGSATVTCVQASHMYGADKPIHTLECEYPRAIHSQLLTHGVFSKNSSSTRAVPLEAAIKQILEKPAKYVWTKNQSGMQGSVLSEEDCTVPDILLGMARDTAIVFAKAMNSKPENGGFDIHKQNAGRLLEPYQNIKIVLTSTEWENWDWLRDHEDAQGEIADLARAMKIARDTAEIMELHPGEWHVPYVGRYRTDDNVLQYFNLDEKDNKVWFGTEEAKDVSASVCAQISYRTADAGLEKAERIKGMLVDGHRVHASPFEHQATPIPPIDLHQPFAALMAGLPDGVTHMRKDGTAGSGNFVGWVQNRQLIKGHDKSLF